MISSGLPKQPSDFAPCPIVASDGEITHISLPADYELAFLDAATQEIGVATQQQELLAALKQHLAYSVARHPLDLRCHVSRIELNFKCRDEDGLYSALLDLFLALQDKGLALRTRMLMGSRSQLSAPHFTALHDGLLAPLTEYATPLGRISVLSRGLTGSSKFIDERIAPSEVHRDPLAEARDYIEYFQLDEARQVLENAVLEAPERADLHSELLCLYKATGDRQHWSIMKAKLKHVIDPLPAEWSTLEPDTRI